MKHAFRLALVVLVSALAAFGDVTGTITGVVTDQSGAAIPNVPVTFTRTGTNAAFQAMSNDLGVFTINTLPVGVYNLQASSALTASLKQLAQQQNIPLVGVSETQRPVGATFQDWQTAQLTALEAALASAR